MSGQDFRELDNVIGMIESSSALISSVVFSGGEPMSQHDELRALARICKDLDFKVAIQTSGFFPVELEDLIESRFINRVALDLKPQCRLSGYYSQEYWWYKSRVQKSIDICFEAWDTHKLEEFETTVTVFRGEESVIPDLLNEEYNVDGDIIIQQGIAQGVVPLSDEEMRDIASKIKTSVSIRTREGGETAYTPQPF